MKVLLLGPAHPYRGGIAAIIEKMARVLSARGAAVRILTFKLQYPRWLFPGQSQTVSTPPPADLDISRAVNTVWPWNWIRVGLRIRREHPDLVILKYWTPFMAPCFGTIARVARSSGLFGGRSGVRFVCQVDNVEPHEHHFFDRALNRYFLLAMDGFVYMSQAVGRELKAYSDAPAVFSPHPLFEQFGSPSGDRAAACLSLGLDPEIRYALFFGLVRDYKGLDLLIEAWPKERGRKLLVVGEFYTDPAPYEKQIADAGLQDDILIFNRFIPDAEVHDWFEAADFLVLPYRTATQSGVTQIAWQFNVPMLVTDVGGLPEIVRAGESEAAGTAAGLVVAPTPAALSAGLQQMWQPDALARFKEAMPRLKSRFSWDAAVDKLLEAGGLS